MYDKAYIEYLAHFHGTRDYFECHEILEERWMQDKPLDRTSIFVAFIQLAVALYHHRRKNFTGAVRILNKGIQKFTLHEQKVEQYGLNQDSFFLLLTTLIERMEARIPYKSIQLPIKDKKLEKEVQDYCQQLGCVYPSVSNLNDNDLIHKHIFRNKEKR